MSGDSFIPGDPPPLTPEGEEVISGSASFLETCHAAWAKIIAKRGWELGEELVTRNEVWGTICRADVIAPRDPNSQSVDRLFFCQTPDGITVYGIGSCENPQPLKKYRQEQKPLDD